jgi:hypothetical protein
MPRGAKRPRDDEDVQVIWDTNLVNDIDDEHTSSSDSESTSSGSESDAPLRRSSRRAPRRIGIHDSRTGETTRDYRDLTWQRSLALRERQRYADALEVRADAHGGQGLFAKRDLRKQDIILSYYGTHYGGESLFLRDYPLDDAMYGMVYSDHFGESEYYDGATVDGLMRYVNHAYEHGRAGNKPNAMLYSSDDSPYVQLRLRRAIQAGEEITIDYGPKYPYAEHHFER